MLRRFACGTAFVDNGLNFLLRKAGAGLLSFTAWEGTNLGDQWGPPQRLRRDVIDHYGSDMAIPARLGSREDEKGNLGGKREVKARGLSTDRSSSIGSIGADNRPSAMGAVGSAIELQDHRAIDQAVEKRGG